MYNLSLEILMYNKGDIIQGISIKSYFVYSLQCPVTNIKFYIGQTIEPDTRYKCHLSTAINNGESNQFCKDIINFILSHGMYPIMNIEEINIQTRIESLYMESVYINKHKPFFQDGTLCNTDPFKKHSIVIDKYSDKWDSFYSNYITLFNKHMNN